MLLNHDWIRMVDESKLPHTIFEFSQIVLEYHKKIPSKVEEENQTNNETNNNILIDLQKQLDDTTKERDSLLKRNKMLENMLNEANNEIEKLKEQLEKSKN